VVDKPYVTLTGTSATSTVIAWNESWVSDESPTVSVLASDFVAKRLTFQVLLISPELSKCTAFSTIQGMRFAWHLRVHYFLSSVVAV
jgi:hypothetical protein